MTDTQTQTKRGMSPTHTAYHLREGKEKAYWTRIGAAWEHKDRKGFSIQIDCIPLDGKISLRITSENKDAN